LESEVASQAAHSSGESRHFIATTPLVRSAARIAPAMACGRRIRELHQQVLGFQLAQVSPVEQLLEGVTRGRHEPLPSWIAVPLARRESEEVFHQAGTIGIRMLSG